MYQLQDILQSFLHHPVCASFKSIYSKLLLLLYVSLEQKVAKALSFSIAFTLANILIPVFMLKNQYRICLDKIMKKIEVESWHSFKPILLWGKLNVVWEIYDYKTLSVFLYTSLLRRHNIQCNGQGISFTGSKNGIQITTCISTIL